MTAVCLRLLQKRKNQYRMRKKEGPGSQGSKIAAKKKKKKGQQGERQTHILCGLGQTKTSYFCLTDPSAEMVVLWKM